jgi:hypothetical protein
MFYYEGDEYEMKGPTRTRVRGDALNETVSIPVISLSWALSRQFKNEEQQQQKGQFMIQTHTTVTMAYTYNLFAETPYGREDRLIVSGSHLDSVQEGVGMNDNGSGASTNLEIALQIARLKMKPVNKAGHDFDWCTAKLRLRFFLTFFHLYYFLFDFGMKLRPLQLHRYVLLGGERETSVFLDQSTIQAI